MSDSPEVSYQSRRGWPLRGSFLVAEEAPNKRTAGTPGNPGKGICIRGLGVLLAVGWGV